MIPVHTRNSFELIVRAPYARTAALFGPNGERCWAGEHWNPQFIYPQPGEDIEGAVFRNRHGNQSSVWVTIFFDIEGRHFQYACFVSGRLVTTIDVSFQTLDERKTRVTVVYARTALDAAANEEVEALAERDRKSGKRWEGAINEYLQGSK